MSRYKNYLMLSVATVAAIVMRLVMAFFITDRESGFINSENIVYGVLIVAILLVAAAVLYFQVLSEQLERLSVPDFSGVLPRVVSFILAMAVIYDVMVKYSSYIYFSWLSVLYVLISFIFVLYLICFIFYSSNKKEMPPLLSVLPVVFWLVRLIMVFTQFSSVSNTVDNILELLTLCIILIFHLTYAKALCLEPTVKILRRLNAVAYLSCYLSFMITIPKIVIVFSGYQNILHPNNRSFLLVFLTGVYIFAFILKHNKK